MDIIIDFYSNQNTSSIFSLIGSSIKLTLIFLLAMVVLGLIASGIEHLINIIIGSVLGSGFALIFCNYLTIPGTILHELSHAFFAVITGAKVTEISFFDLSLTSLGHVSYINRGTKFQRGIQNSLTACAPVITGSLALIILLNIYTSSSHSAGVNILLIYLIVCVIDHMTMSITDIINYFRGILPTSVFVFIVNLVLLVLCR